MNKSRILASIGVGVLLYCASPMSMSAVYMDSFESGDLTVVSSDGFTWGAPNNTGVVKDVAHDGVNSLRFSYPAGKFWSEQRFKLGVSTRDLWIRFWLRVPTNYNFGPAGSPNKFFAIWSDGYSQNGDGSTVWWGMHRIGDGDANLALTYSPGGYTSSLAYQQGVSFITAKDRGRWMQLVLHARVESSRGAGDGLMETWRRWEDERTFVKLHELKGVPIRLPTSGTPTGFQAGYILGWANAAYVEDTVWNLDEFTVANESLLSVTDSVSPPSPPEVKVD